MDRYTPRPEPAYPGEMNDANISAIFYEAGDFVRRSIRCGDFDLYMYAIDGLVSGGDISEYVLKPVCEKLVADTMEELYARALSGTVYNAVAQACNDLDDVALKLVNGFCVILF